ncbi:FkbM family methyltransferase [Candidatus Pelagibacter sp.]|jgi:FkbM family methyltransferase|nr:FkbM family methyltransferase [Candidatus Pelagibacter sp.]
MKLFEKNIKDWIIKTYPFNKLYFILKIIKKSKKRYYYADNGEDVIIRSLFNHKKNGFYVDVGCYHPIKASLTYMLHKKGWYGLNIDISKDSINLFKIARPKDTNLNIGISNKKGEDYYYQLGHINQANSFKVYENAKKIKVEISTLDEVIKKLKIKKIDFLNIDAEYKDLEALQGISLESVRPTLITIEDADRYDMANVIISDVYKYLISKNYFLFSRTVCTSFYLDKKYKDNLDEILNTRTKKSL